MMLFRPLNEAIQLAEYFLNSKETQEGKGKLNAWFNKNASPLMKTVRTMNNRTSKPIFDEYKLTDFVESHQLSIHTIQSKSVHNTYNDIYRLFGFFRQVDKIDWFIEYEETTNIIELNESLQYLLIDLPAIIRGFQICFQNMLTDEDFLYLEKMFWQIRNEYRDLIKSRKKDS